MPGDISKTPNAVMPSPEFVKDHTTATSVENKVNGNVRTSNSNFNEKNGSSTMQVVSRQSTGTIYVQKVHIP